MDGISCYHAPKEGTPHDIADREHTMKRLSFIAILAIAGLAFSAKSADAQYRYTTQYNPYLGGYVSQAYYGTPWGVKSATSFYSPYTGATYNNYGYANPYGSTGTSYGYNPMYGSSYYKGYNATPFGGYRYGYKATPFGGYQYGYGY